MPEPEPPPSPALAELVAVMAHDLKNPLAALVTNLHYLRGTLDGVSTDALDALDESALVCETLERLTRNLDLLARRDALEGRRYLVAVGALVDDVLGRARHHAATAGVELVGPTAGAHEPVAFVDRDLFRRALENLLAHALEHAPRGSRVSVELTVDEGSVSVVITDARPALPSPAEAQEGRSLQARYGRGLSLLCAELAAKPSGATLVIDGVPGACRARLTAPSR